MHRPTWMVFSQQNCEKEISDVKNPSTFVRFMNFEYKLIRTSGLLTIHVTKPLEATTQSIKMASSSPLKKKKKSCRCDLEDEGGRCSHCQRSFENIHQFVRHVTHSKECKANYEPGLIDDFKVIARQATKRKWYHDQAHGPNSKAFKEGREKNRKIYYVPNNVKYSDCGNAFNRLFKPIYQKCLDEAKLMIEKQALDQDFLTKRALEEALDKAFSGDTLDYVFLRMTFDEKLARTEDENLIWEIASERFENSFDSIWSTKCKAHRDDWRDFHFNEVCNNLYKYVQNKVFLDCFEQFEFKKLYGKAIDNALDEIFLKLTTLDGYFDDEKDLGKQMDSVFNSVLNQEIQKLFQQNDELQSALKVVVEGVLKKRFEKNDLKYAKLE